MYGRGVNIDRPYNGPPPFDVHTTSVNIRGDLSTYIVLYFIARNKFSFRISYPDFPQPSFVAIFRICKDWSRTLNYHANHFVWLLVAYYLHGPNKLGRGLYDALLTAPLNTMEIR